MPQSNTKIYYPVTHKKRAGALIATEDSVAFHDDEKNGNKVVELHWHEVARINCNVATSPTALLKLTTIHGQTPTFKLESRKELEKAKADLKAYWKAAHEESIRDCDCDDEDFSESKRDGDDLLYIPPSPKRNQSTKTRSKTPPKTRSKTPPKTGQQQQRFANAKRRASTGHLPRIDSGHSLKWPPAAATDTSTDSHNNLYYPKWNVQQPTKQNHGFSKASHVHLLPKDQIQLPRAAGGQFQLDFSNFAKTQQLPVFILHSNGTIGATQTLKLEELLTEKKDQTDIEAQAVHAEEGYQISRRVCVTSVMAVACGVCVMLLMAVALVVLSILLWEQQNESDSSGGGLGTDDFYAGYFNQRPP